MGLRELFLRAHEIADISLPLPPAASGLMRVLYVLTAQITGLTDTDDASEWRERRHELLNQADAGFDPDEVRRHLAGQAVERFDLFGANRAWLQDPRLAKECGTSGGVNKLVWGRVAGNNQVFLSHDVDAEPRPIPTAEAVWHLLAWLYYGSSGRCTSRTVDDRSEANVSAGPLRRSISFHPWGRNLCETLLAGLVYEDTIDTDYAPWDEPDLPDPLGLPPEPTGLPRLLAGRFRHAVLLVPSGDGASVTDAYITWAWREPQGMRDDPYLLFRRNRDGTPYAAHAQADRAIWRDLDALLLKDAEGRATRRPRVFAELATTGGDVAEHLRVRAFGFDQDGQAKDKQYFSGSTPPVLGYLEEHDPKRAYLIRDAHDAAERSGESLRRSLTRAWREITRDKNSGVPWLGSGMAKYWSEAESEFWDITRTGRLVPNVFILRAVAAYEAATDDYAYNPHNVRAIETNRSWLFHGWEQEQGE